MGFAVGNYGVRGWELWGSVVENYGVLREGTMWDLKVENEKIFKGKQGGF